MYKTRKFSTVHGVIFKKSGFLKAFSIFHLVILKRLNFSYAFSELFLGNFTLPVLSISLCEFAALRLCTFFLMDGLETKSQHCYKYTDTNQLINPGPNVAQSQVNFKAITHTFPWPLLLATVWDKILCQPNFCF